MPTGQRGFLFFAQEHFRGMLIDVGELELTSVVKSYGEIKENRSPSTSAHTHRGSGNAGGARNVSICD